MKKNLLFIGYNYTPEPTGIGKYSGEQVEWLAKQGYDCTVLASYPYYPFWKVQEPYYKNRYWYKTEIQHFNSGGKITIHRCPMYVPEVPSGLKRILLDFTFLISALFMLVTLLPRKKFDFIITVLPSVTLGLLGIFYKAIRGTRLICHVHDMQIEAARDLGMIKSKKIIASLFKLEKWIFNKCDVVTCVGEGMARKVKAKAHKEIPLFFNTTDLEFFHPIGERDLLKLAFGFNPADKILLYSGAIGEKQGVEAILYAAQEFNNYSNLKFLICGSGPYKEKLQTMAQELKLLNVQFLPLQPIEKFNQFLNMADVHLIIQKANAGDLVMPSKLNTVLAIGGLALVTANEGSGMYNLLHNYKMGILVDAECQQALNDGIRRAITEDTSLLERNARLYAETFLSIDKIMKHFEQTCLRPGQKHPTTVQELLAG